MTISSQPAILEGIASISMEENNVAEHPDVIETVEKQLDLIASCEDKLDVLNKHFGN